MLVEIETKCGECIVSDKICPFKHYGFQSTEDFCNLGKAYSEKCDYCSSHTLGGFAMHTCHNRFMCGLAQEIIDFTEHEDISKISLGAYNMAVELNIIDNIKGKINK